MKDPRDIMPAIDLLMNAKRSRRLPWWVRPLDYSLTAAYCSVFVYAIYKMIQCL